MFKFCLTVILLASIQLHLNGQCAGNASWLNNQNDGMMQDTGLVAGTVLVYASTHGTMSSGRPLYRTTTSVWKGLNFTGLQVWRAYSSIASNYTSFALSSPLDSNVFHVRVDNIRGDFPNMESQSVQGFYRGAPVASTFKDPVNGATRSGNTILGGGSTNSTTQSAMRVFFHSAVDSVVIQQTSLSDWIIAELMVECMYLLPDHPFSWNVYRNDAGVMATWTVDRPASVSSFDVERSSGSGEFRKIASVNAGTSENRYTANDPSPMNGKNFYRLKLMYNNGLTAYSDTRVINWSKPSTLAVYPNPASSAITISESGRYQFDIYALDGKKLESRSNLVGPLQLDISGWPRGSYLIRVNGTRTAKILLTR